MKQSSALRRLEIAKLRATVARIEVLEVFEARGERALYMDAVHRELMERGSPIGLSTVYRVAQQLAERGILVRSWNIKRTAMLYRLKLEGHDPQPMRMSCTGNAQSIAFDDAVLRRRLIALLRLHGVEDWHGTLILEARLPFAKSTGSASNDAQHGGGQRDPGASQE